MYRRPYHLSRNSNSNTVFLLMGRTLPYCGTFSYLKIANVEIISTSMLFPPAVPYNPLMDTINVHLASWAELSFSSRVLRTLSAIQVQAGNILFRPRGYVDIPYSMKVVGHLSYVASKNSHDSRVHDISVTNLKCTVKCLTTIQCTDCPLYKKFRGEFMRIINQAPTTQSTLTMKRSAAAIKSTLSFKIFKLRNVLQDHLHNNGD